MTRPRPRSCSAVPASRVLPVLRTFPSATGPGAFPRSSRVWHTTPTGQRNLCLWLPAGRGAGREGKEQEAVRWGWSCNRGWRRCGNSHLGNTQLLLVTDRAWDWSAFVRMTLKCVSEPWTGRPMEIAEDVSLTAPPKTEPQRQNGFRLCWGLYKWVTSVHMRSCFHRKEREVETASCCCYGVLLATEILKEKTSQIVLRNLCLLGHIQLNTVLHLFKIHRTKFVKYIGGRVAHKLHSQTYSAPSSTPSHLIPQPHNTWQKTAYSLFRINNLVAQNQE